MTAEVHALYRFYGDDGALLYVGITNNPGRRWAQHGRVKPWWHDVARIELERHPDRPAVLAAETAAIRTEHPQHNIVHAAGGPPPPAAATGRGELAAPACTCGRTATYVFLLDVELTAHLQARQRQRAAWDGRLTVLSASAFLEAPTWTVWRFGCDEHAPEVGAYGFRWPRTWPELGEWTAHLLEAKPEWIGETSWHAVLRAATTR